MSSIDFTPAETTATGVRPSSRRSALTSMAEIYSFTFHTSIHLVNEKVGQNREIQRELYNIWYRFMFYCLTVLVNTKLEEKGTHQALSTVIYH